MKHEAGAKMLRKRTEPSGSAPSEQDTRERLLNAVGDLMTVRRSTDVSLSDIATQSGVNASLVKYYFGNKAGLMIALLRRALGPKVQAMAELATMPISAPHKLRLHIGGIVNSYFDFPYVNRLMHSLLADDAIKFGPLIADEFSRPVAKLQRQILDEGVAAGHFRDVDPVFFYIQIIGACDQLFYGRYQLEGVFGITEIDDGMRRQFADHLYDSVMRGLACEVSRSDRA